jgi:glycosyltransferase involved in cell wall biosynthesis
LKEVVRAGETGLLVAAGDHEALAQAIITLLSDEEYRARLVSAAQQRVATEFAPHAVLAHYCQVYREAIGAS